MTDTDTKPDAHVKVEIIWQVWLAAGFRRSVEYIILAAWLTSLQVSFFFHWIIFEHSSGRPGNA